MISLIDWISGYSDVKDVVRIESGVFVVDNDKLIAVLQKGSKTDILNILEILGDEMINIPMEKRIQIWGMIESSLDLKRLGKFRSESFKVLEKILSFNGMSPDAAKNLYDDLKKNIHYEFDPDMKLILICLHQLANYKVVEWEYLVDLFNVIDKNYKNDDIKVLIISLVTQEMVKTSQLGNVFEKLINLSIISTDTLVLKSFINFLENYIAVGGEYIDKLYTLLTIVGCVYDLNESIEECENIIGTMFQKYGTTFLITLCDVISCKYNEKYPHRKGNRCVIGSIRILCYLLKLLGTNKVFTQFFDEYRYYIFESLMENDKSEMLFIEIVKFVNEVIEKPYCMNGYYEEFVENDIFWDLISYNGNEYDVSFQNVMQELFNKLQNLNLNKYHVKRLVEYLDQNYEILNTYNIEFVIKYYSSNLLCVCGAPRWKEKCNNVVERYYSTCADQILELLGNAMKYCLSLNLDDQTINFYVDILFYQCIIGLEFELDAELIFGKIAKFIKELEKDKFEKIIDDYQKSIINGDKNAIVMNQVIVQLVMTISDDRCVIAMDNIMEIASKVKNDEIFAINLSIMGRIRFNKNRFQIKYWESMSCVYGYEIEEQINKMYFNMNLKGSFKMIFEKGAEFSVNFNIEKLFKVYSDVLNNEKSFERYLLVTKDLRNQLLNLSGVLEKNNVEMNELLNFFKTQIEEVCEIKFEKPSWISNNGIKIIALDVIYGFLPYMKNGLIEKVNDIFRTIVLEYHFSKDSKKEYVNFICVCFYELSEIIKKFIVPILKMIFDDTNDVLNLPILLHLKGLAYTDNDQNLKIGELIKKLEDNQIVKVKINTIVCDSKIMRDEIEKAFGESHLQVMYSATFQGCNFISVKQIERGYYWEIVKEGEIMVLSTPNVTRFIRNMLNLV